ncbi:integrase/recombinase xerD homolog isoform X2 [Mytilus trossulus]|uniref:integrase/recombinase xerD homolog isoform X2 n=1 Tax=Mytilus trossulus TaxID=6551 RepID=UPI003006B6FD
MKEADSILDGNNPTPDTVCKAKEKLAEGISLMNYRQKLIRIADSSELGWRVVHEYETNPLADDSEDERKLYKAENIAERKVKADKTKKARRVHPYVQPAEQAVTSMTRKPGRCFNCGVKGHWKQECPEKQQRKNDKISNINTLYRNNIEVHVDNLRTKVDTIKSPVNNLRKHINKWKIIQASDYILNVIEKGYMLPLKTLPENVLLDNNRSAKENKSFVTDEIEKLLSKGCISEVFVKPKVVNPLTVAGIGLRDKIKDDVKEAGVDEESELFKYAEHMSSYIVNSRSDNTSKSYLYAFKRWETFIKKHGFQALPAQPVHIALYITYLLDTGATCNTINSAIYSIKWVHEMSNFADPTKNSYIHSLQESAKRVATVKKHKKDPVSLDMLLKLCSMFSDSQDLLVVRDLTMILLSFAGFLRFDEISSLLCKNVEVKSDYLILYIEKSKTDQYRNGNEVLISKGDTIACPYEMFLKYVNLSGVILESNFFLFRPIFRSKSICKLIYKNKKLSYTTARESIISRLKLVSKDLKLGLHSMRSGGATAAANSDVNDRVWKRHGRWKSDSSKDGNVVDSVDKRLQVTKHLGL